jgi:trans-aconitate methyltransferase
VADASSRNKETYDRLWAGDGDFTRFHPGARHRRRHVLDLLAAEPFDSLLDVGCGNGLLLSQIDARFPGKRLAGSDLSGVALERNRARFPHMAFSLTDLATGELPGGFDVVLCSEVVEHVDDPQGCMDRLARACRPGGRVVVTCPTGPMYPTERHFGHVYHPTEQELVAWGERAGLAVEQVSCWGFPTYALTKWVTNVNPKAALRRFGMDQRYGVLERAVASTLFWLNFANRQTSPRGVQLFAVFRKPGEAP